MKKKNHLRIYSNKTNSLLSLLIIYLEINIIINGR